MTTFAKFLSLMTIVPVMLAFWASSPALANDQATDYSNDLDCSQPQETQTGMNICAGEDYKQADAALNAAYKRAQASMKEFLSYDAAKAKAGKKKLIEAQRAWIKFRDLACEVEGLSSEGGTIQPLMISTCLTKLTKRRTEDLLELSTLY